jgi:hypothetical protein
MSSMCAEQRMLAERHVSLRVAWIENSIDNAPTLAVERRQVL